MKDKENNLDIIKALQRTVDNISTEEYVNDSCPPEFKVSLYEEFEGDKIINHKILLTISHLNHTLSRTIFPNLKYTYGGYESIKDEMKWLYNATM